MSPRRPEQSAEPAFRPLGGRTGTFAGLALRYAALASLVLVFVGPFLWLASTSIRTSGNVYDLELIPAEPTLQYYREVWSQYNLDRAFLNSLLVALIQVGSNLLLCSLAAYPLARMKFPGSRFVFLLILSTMMVPFQLYMVPLFLLGLNIGLFDTLVGVVIPSAAGAFGIFMIKQHYATIPGDLEEAARIDGAGEFRIWAEIMLPLTKPALAALAVFVFVQSWSNFLWPLVILDRTQTLPVAIARLSGDFIDKTQYIAAGSVVAVAPVIALFFLVQRWFIGGMTAGSVKG